MTESNASLPVIPPGVTNLELLDSRDGAFGVKGSGDTSGFGGLVDPRVMPGASQAPFGGWFDEVAEEIELSLADQGLQAEQRDGGTQWPLVALDRTT